MLSIFLDEDAMRSSSSKEAKKMVSVLDHLMNDVRVIQLYRGRNDKDESSSIYKSNEKSQRENNDGVLQHPAGTYKHGSSPSQNFVNQRKVHKKVNGISNKSASARIQKRVGYRHLR
jgi:hypothetical protein